MCTYHIFAPPGTYASLKIISLDIIGPFRNMYASAGVAIYNVINQNRSLVAHWHTSIRSGYGEFVITSTENELYMAVFGYSPFSIAVLSYHFRNESSLCIGRLIGRFMRPSLLITPMCSRSSQKIYPCKQCFIQIKLTHECLASQLIFLPSDFLYWSDYYCLSFWCSKKQCIFRKITWALLTKCLHIPAKYMVNIAHIEQNRVENCDRNDRNSRRHQLQDGF